jgi:hypothetical protein
MIGHNVRNKKYMGGFQSETPLIIGLLHISEREETSELSADSGRAGRLTIVLGDTMRLQGSAYCQLTFDYRKAKPYTAAQITIPEKDSHPC